MPEKGVVGTILCIRGVNTGFGPASDLNGETFVSCVIAMRIGAEVFIFLYRRRKE